MLQSHNEAVVLVLTENLFIFDYDFFESFHVTWFNAIDNLEVWWKWFLEISLRENLSVWNFSHQELDNNLKLLNLDSESFGSNFWTFSKSLNKSCLGFWVLKLNSFNSSEIVQVSRVLVVWYILREVSLNDELSSLFIHVLREIRSQYDICNCSLTNEIFSKAWGFVWFKH